MQTHRITLVLAWTLLAAQTSQAGDSRGSGGEILNAFVEKAHARLGSILAEMIIDLRDGRLTDQVLGSLCKKVRIMQNDEEAQLCAFYIKKAAPLMHNLIYQTDPNKRIQLIVNKKTDPRLVGYDTNPDTNEIEEIEVDAITQLGPGGNIVFSYNSLVSYHHEAQLMQLIAHEYGHKIPLRQPAAGEDTQEPLNFYVDDITIAPIPIDPNVTALYRFRNGRELLDTIAGGILEYAYAKHRAGMPLEVIDRVECTLYTFNAGVRDTRVETKVREAKRIFTGTGVEKFDSYRTYLNFSDKSDYHQSGSVSFFFRMVIEQSGPCKADLAAPSQASYASVHAKKWTPPDARRTDEDEKIIYNESRARNYQNPICLDLGRQQEMEGDFGNLSLTCKYLGSLFSQDRVESRLRGGSRRSL